MSRTQTVVAATGLLLALAGIVQAEVTPYYNPANKANETGLTAGSNLYRTIGCPGQGLLEQDCSEAAPAPVAQTAPAEPAAQATPAPVAASTPAPVATVAPVPEPVPVTVVAAEKQPSNPYEECYGKLMKQTADSFKEFNAMFFKPVAAR